MAGLFDRPLKFQSNFQREATSGLSLSIADIRNVQTKSSCTYKSEDLDTAFARLVELSVGLSKQTSRGRSGILMVANPNSNWLLITSCINVFV